MKNSIYIRTVKLFLVSGLSLIAFHSLANAQAHNEDEFKVELKPNSATSTSTSKAEAKAEAESKVVTDVKKVVAENTEKEPVVKIAPAPSPTPAPEVKAVVNPEPPVTAQTPVPTKKSLAYNRDIQIVDGQAVYIVNGRAPHLYMVSRDLYGSDRMWKAIADWNALKAPYDLNPGQRLVLKKAPTVSNADADRILLKQWSQMDRWDIVKGIILAQQGQPAQAEETHAPAVGAVLPAPPPESHEENAAPEATPVAIAAQAPHTAHHGHWKFKTAVVLSYFTLQNNNNDVPVDNELNSELDYGIELEAAYHFNDRTEMILGAAVEKMDIAHSEEESEIEGHAQYLAKYSLGFETKLSRRIIGAGYAIYEQNPVAEPTLDGVNVEGIFIPQIQAGFRWGLIDSGNFSAWLITDGIYAFKASKNDIELNEGGGFLAGFKFANELSKRTLTYGVSYRELKQDTDTSTNALKTFYGNIGLIW
jgi:hypothetical protein